MLEISTSPTPPVGANVLCGAVDNAAATLIAIPANRTWTGEIVISASAAGTAALTFKPNVVTPNTAGVFPQNQVVARVVASWVVTTAGSNSVSQAFKVTVVNTTGSAINLTTVLTGSGTTTTAEFTANGVLL